METIDNRAKLFELEEIFKYKDLIEVEDRDLLKKVIFDTKEESDSLYSEFLSLVADEIDHKLNKVEFTDRKNELMAKMKAYLA